MSKRSLVQVLLCSSFLVFLGVIVIIHFRPEKALRSTTVPGNLGWPEFSPDGKQFAVATGKGIIVWNASNWTQSAFLPGDADDVYWSPDGKTLLTFGSQAIDLYTHSLHYAGDIRRWNVNTGKTELSVPVPSGSVLQAISTDHSRMLISTLIRNPSQFSSPAPNPSKFFRSQWEVWDTAAGRKISVLPGSWYFEPQFSSDKRFLAAVVIGKPNRFHLWNASTWREIKDVPINVSNIEAVRFSPDAKTLAVGTEQKIVFYDTKSWLPTRSLPAQFKMLFRLRFSADGKWLVASGISNEEEKDAPGKHLDYYWSLWNAADGHKVADAHHSYFSEIIPGSDLILANSDAQEVVIFDATKSKPIWTTEGHTPGKLDNDKYAFIKKYASVSPDARRIVVISNILHPGESITVPNHDTSIIQSWKLQR
jgi:hypothetical protein